MLLVWDLPVTRPTRDIDLLGRVGNDLENIRRIIGLICEVPVDDDGMEFDPGSVETSRIAEDADYEGVRATFDAKLLRRVDALVHQSVSRAGTCRGHRTKTFRRRGTPFTNEPVCFNGAFSASAAKAVQWQAFIRRGQFADPAPPFAEIVEVVAGFLRPINAGLLAGEAWTRTWPEGGPWIA